MIKIGLIGSSGHYGYALDIIAQDPQLQLVGFAKSHPAERIPTHRAFQEHTQLFASPEELLDQNLDLVIVDSVYGFHGKFCIQAAERNLPIYCEKPVATNLEELAQLERLVIERGLPFGCMLDTRTHPLVQRAKQLIEQGTLGEIALAFGQKSYKFGSRPQWFNDPALYGSSILWVAIHAIDWTRFLTGKEFCQVEAHTQHLLPEYPNLDSAGTLHFAFADGGSAIISYDYHRHPRAKTHGDDRIRIVGTKGTLEARLDENYLDISTDLTLEETSKRVPSLFAQFIGYLRGEGATPIKTEDIFATTRWALYAQLSAERREPVSD